MDSNLLKKFNRPYLSKEFLGNNVTLEIRIRGSTFRVPHDRFHAWVGMHKTALETVSWLRDGIYHWPHVPRDMLRFLERYRDFSGRN